MSIQQSKESKPLVKAGLFKTTDAVFQSNIPCGKLSILQITSKKELHLYLSSLKQLIKHFKENITHDDANYTSNELADNLYNNIPYLWILVDDSQKVWAGASIDALTEGQHGYIHGIRLKVIRKHPALSALTLTLLSTAFDQLKFTKLKAEIRGDNKGAKGFCLRLGFTKEAHFKNEVTANGEPKDLLVYSLFSDTFYTSTRRKLHHVIWKKKESKQKCQNKSPKTN